jgi:hypothetical protein
MASLCRRHTRQYDWEMFESHEEFLDEVQRKGAKLGKRMIYENKKKMCEKYLKEPPSWILGTIRKETNLFDLLSNETLEELPDHHDTTLVY